MASADVDITHQSLSNDPSDPEPRGLPTAVAAEGFDPQDDMTNRFNDSNAQTFGDIEENGENNARNDLQDDQADLGIDEEVKVRKARAPIAKLDEERLLSEKGIPKLRKITKDRLRFRGKGHEFSDVNKLLNFYQLWLDELFPKAKFADGLSIIEKLGHKKRLAVMRKAWIDEGKTKSDEPDMSDGDADYTGPNQEPEAMVIDRNEEIFGPNRDSQLLHASNKLDMSNSSSKPTTNNPATRQSGRSMSNENPEEIAKALASKATTGLSPEEDDEDELDALLAEDTQWIHEVKPTNREPLADDDFDDDMDAMNAMYDV